MRLVSRIPQIGKAISEIRKAIAGTPHFNDIAPSVVSGLDSLVRGKSPYAITAGIVVGVAASPHS